MSQYNNVERSPLYFGEPQAQLFGWYHWPKKNSQSTAVVICPPIGYEYVHSHRSLRHLADHLAQAGIPSLRFDYHGSGDSAGVDEDPQRVDAWLDSIRAAIRQVRSLSGCERVGLVGFRMGATFAAMIAEQQQLACLVLWAPCVRGRNYTREMKALRMTGNHKAPPSAVPEGVLEGGGFVLTPQTIDSLSKIDLHKVIPQATDILVMMRDDLAEVSQKLDQWITHGVELEYLKFSGYADMVAEPHYTKIPYPAIEQLADWLVAHTTPASDGAKKPAAGSADFYDANNVARSIVVGPSDFEAQVLNQRMADIRESLFPFAENNRLFGVLSEPLNEEWKKRPTIVLANSGSVHHVGPNRLYVLLARNISRAGFRCLRMDFPGLGDSFIDDSEKENDSYVASATKDIDDAIKALRQDASSFVVMGLCSGAHAAFHVAIELKSQPISECLLMNPLTFYWKEGMSLAGPPGVDNRWHYYKNTMRKKERWLKLIRGEADIIAILHTVREKVAKLLSVWSYRLLRALHLAAPAADNLQDDLKSICHTGRRMSFVFATTDPGYDILMSNAKGAVRKYMRKKMIDIQFVEDADHTFTTNAHRVELVNKVIDHLVRRYP